MFKISSVFLSITMALILAGCNNDSSNLNELFDNNPTPVVQDAEIRVTHASPDAPAVNVYINGSLILEGVDYKQSSGIVPIEATTFSVEVRGILPDGSEASVVGPVDLQTTSGQRLDIIATGNLFDDQGNVTLDATRISTPTTAPMGARINVVHAAPDVADVDIYLTAPGDDLTGLTPIDADFGFISGPVDLMADTEYRVRITADGDSSTVVYDSGTLSFAAGTDLVVAAVENTSTGTGPVNLLAIGPDGATELFTEATGVVTASANAEVRVVHNSADTPAVDILVNGGVALDAVPFPSASDYANIAAPAGTYTVVVAADADNSIAPIDVNLDLAADTSYTVIAIGGLNNITDNTLQPVLTLDSRRELATAAQIRVVHGSYAVAESIPVDVYLTATEDITNATPAITNLAYGEFTEQLQITGGDYYVTVTAAGDASVVAFAAGPLTLAANNNYTVIARDPGAEEQGAPLILATILDE